MLSLSVIKSYNGDNSHEYVKYWLLGMVYTHLVLLEVVIFMFICGIDRECDGGHLSVGIFDLLSGIIGSSVTKNHNSDKPHIFGCIASKISLV